VFEISRHGQPESYYTRERHQRRASVLHQPAAADASRGAAERAAKHADIHSSGTRSGHRSQYTLLHRQGQEYVFDVYLTAGFEIDFEFRRKIVKNHQ